VNIPVAAMASFTTAQLDSVVRASDLCVTAILRIVAAGGCIITKPISAVQTSLSGQGHTVTAQAVVRVKSTIATNTSVAMAG